MTRARRPGDPAGGGAPGATASNDGGRGGRPPARPGTRVALVVGGTGILGRGPRALAGAGFRFLVLAKSAAHAKSAEETWRAAGLEVDALPLDVQRDGAV